VITVEAEDRKGGLRGGGCGRLTGARSSAPGVLLQEVQLPRENEERSVTGGKGRLLADGAVRERDRSETPRGGVGRADEARPTFRLVGEVRR
jgi:hypothetical protein